MLWRTGRSAGSRLAFPLLVAACGMVAIGCVQTLDYYTVCPGPAVVPICPSRNVDAMPSPTTSVSCPPNSILCDDFQSPTINTTQWMLPAPCPAAPCSGSTLTIDSPPTAHDGPLALHAAVAPQSAPQNTCEAWLTAQIAPTRPQMYVRLFVYVPSSAAFQGNMLVDFKSGDSGDVLLLSVWNDSAFALGEPGCSPPQLLSGAIIRDDWNCVEMLVDAGPNTTMCTAGIAEAWLGGVPFSVPQATDQAQSAPQTQLPVQTTPPFYHVSIGLNVWATCGTAAAVDVWIDGVVLSPVRVGCGS